MQSGARRELEILTTIAEGGLVSQRSLARRVGIAVGLANLYVKRLTRKGYIKVTTIAPHRIKYLVTPRGLVEKTRLTYEFMRHSLRLYREARRTFGETLRPLVEGGTRRVVLYGTGEAAELAYLALKALGVEPAAIVDGDSRGSFLGQPVRRLLDLSPGDYDLLVLATLDPPDRLLAELEEQAVPRSRLVLLQPRGVAERAAGEAGKRRPA